MFPPSTVNFENNLETTLQRRLLMISAQLMVTDPGHSRCDVVMFPVLLCT